MTALNASAARNAVAAQPRPSFAPLYTTPIDATSDPQARLSHREARQLVCEIRTWARQFNAPDAKALAAAMDDMERLLLWLWTEMDESLLRLTLADSASTPEKAAELRAVAMQFLGRWLGRQGTAQG
ncbi:hypothetical protein V8Z74_12065 [Comamonas sp. w2-DMI]|uniref:hypothetical protein n=1 Tax=Comamonas sp. w2-DMI TaxID=3126391 RepID=UPI0032E4B201